MEKDGRKGKKVEGGVVLRVCLSDIVVGARRECE